MTQPVNPQIEMIKLLKRRLDLIEARMAATEFQMSQQIGDPQFAQEFETLLAAMIDAAQEGN